MFQSFLIGYGLLMVCTAAFDRSTVSPTPDYDTTVADRTLISNITQTNTTDDDSGRVTTIGGQGSSESDNIANNITIPASMSGSDLQETSETPRPLSLLEEYEYNQALYNLVGTIGRVVKSEISKSSNSEVVPLQPSPQLSRGDDFVKVIEPVHTKSFIQEGKVEPEKQGAETLDARRKLQSSKSSNSEAFAGQDRGIGADDEKIVTVRPLPTNRPVKVDSIIERGDIDNDAQLGSDLTSFLLND